MADASPDPTTAAARQLERAAGARWNALTPEQRARRAELAHRTATISAGVKPPESGIFGRPGAPPKGRSAG